MSYGTEPEAGCDPMRRPWTAARSTGRGRMLGVLIVPLVPIVLLTITLRWPTWKRGCRRGERSTAARSWRGCDRSVMKPLKQAVGPAIVERADAQISSVCTRPAVIASCSVRWSPSLRSA
jgi:hypothetical protein